MALSAWVTAAFELWDDPEARLYHVVVSPEWKEAFASPLDEFDSFWPGYPTASTHTDVTLRTEDQLLVAKIEGLRAHASQMTALFDAYGDDFVRALSSREHFRLSPPARHEDVCGGRKQSCFVETRHRNEPSSLSAWEREPFSEFSRQPLP